MLQNHSILLYLMASSGATFSGILFSLAVEKLERFKIQICVCIYSVITLTPFGAWVISTFVKLKSLRFQKTATPA